MKLPSFSRSTLVGSLLVLVAVLILGQMVRIQSSTVVEKIKETYDVEKRTVYPERGDLYDRWGNLLAGNHVVYEVGIDLQTVSNPETIAQVVESVLGLPYGETLQKANTPYKKGVAVYYKLTDFVEPDVIERLASMKKDYSSSSSKNGGKAASLKGLVWTAHLQRSYPEKTLASNLIGFYSFRRDITEMQGYYGVEGKYDEILSGQPRDLVIKRDPNLIQEIPNIPPGSSLILTIDRDIQAMAEETVDAAVRDNGAESGTIIIEDPRSGEILAMATTPRMDLNLYYQDYEAVFPGQTPFNRAISQTYEPGSIFKVLTMAAALDAGVVKPDTSFYDTGSIQVGGLYINNWNDGAWGQQDMIGCMQHSLNVCLAWIATQLGPTKFYEYLQAFGIGHRTDIDLSGEANFPLSIPGDSTWSEASLGTNAFGQGLATTPIQMVMSIASVANDGKMMAPHVLKAVIDNGKQYNISPQVAGQPISAETAHTLTNMLTTSLEKEASDALVEGYSVAGKTGTAEIPTPNGYTSDLTNASFIGWGPTDDPRFIVYVWLEKPTSDIWGSTVAAPVFSDIVKKLVVLMDLPPDSTRQQIMGQ
jgi:cell division protein FtsI/penicillin-binding protein 2